MIASSKTFARIALTPLDTTLRVSKPESISSKRANVGSNINNWRISLPFSHHQRILRSNEFCHFFFHVEQFHLFIQFLDEITGRRSSRPLLYQHSWLRKNSAFVILGFLEGTAWQGTSHPCTFVYFQFQDLDTIKRISPLVTSPIWVSHVAVKLNFPVPFGPMVAAISPSF